MVQRRRNCTELRSMDSYIQILSRFQKCKRKVPPPSPFTKDFEKNCFFSKNLITFLVFLIIKFFEPLLESVNFLCIVFVKKKLRMFRQIFFKFFFESSCTRPIFGIYIKFGYKNPSILAPTNSVSVAT